MSLKVHIGPMRSGKTKALLDELTEADIGTTWDRIFLLRHQHDTRDGPGSPTSIRTGDGFDRDHADMGSIEVVWLKNLEDFQGIVDTMGFGDYWLIGIDEGQFFQDIHEKPPMWMDRWCVMDPPEGRADRDCGDLQIVIAGLTTTFERKPFGNMDKLLPKCDTVVTHHAICVGCPHRRPATFSYARQSMPASGISIGGTDKYSPMCRRCHVRAILNK